MNVTLCDSSKSSIGNPMSKFHYVTNGADTITGENILILDADTAWFGDINALFDAIPDDMQLVVQGELNPSRGWLKKTYFDPDFFEKTFPGVSLPPFVFNSGHFVVKIGAFDFDEATPYLETNNIDTIPPLFPYDQGIFNFIHAQKKGLGEIKSTSLEFAKWPGHTITFDGFDAHPFLVHWAGKTSYTISKMNYGHHLRTYRKFYLDALPLIDRIGEILKDSFRIFHYRLRLLRLFLIGKRSLHK